MSGIQCLVRNQQGWLYALWYVNKHPSHEHTKDQQPPFHAAGIVMIIATLGKYYLGLQINRFASGIIYVELPYVECKLVISAAPCFDTTLVIGSSRTKCLRYSAHSIRVT
ncbi:hypothetical protein F4703DRAFT_1912956 [Phycomyces blakesleeanus]